MNFLIIGLGNFGSELSIKLTQLGHEVIGVDKRMEKVELFKDDITHTICADCTDIHAAKDLPVTDTDAVIICIGENEGESIMATAMMKQLKAKRIISRAVSSLQETVLNSMGIEEILYPEADAADKLSKMLSTKYYIDSFDLSNGYSIVKATVPEKYEGKLLRDLDLRNSYSLTMLTTISPVKKRNIFGVSHDVLEVNEVANASTILKKNDIMVLYGHAKDIENFLT
ncbi:MAG: TrkA family potassium uptake protein [Bacteroidales bacterium]|nr:TrkA family potassium uptake protein [Bacteroidales bacterium]